MILRRTARGGGWMRYWRFQETMMIRMWETKDIHPYAPVALFDFQAHPHDVADAAAGVSRNRQYDGWRIADDRVIGGYSYATASLIQTTQDLYKNPPSITHHQQRISSQNTNTLQDAENDKNDDDDNIDDDQPLETNDDDDVEEDQPLARPFMRWTGHLDTTIGLESRVQRSGFAALKSPEFSLFNGANLRGAYSALEIVCRTDGRVYTVQLEIGGSLLMPSSSSTGSSVNVFKGHIDVDATTNTNSEGDGDDDSDEKNQQYWDVLYLPFADFSLGDDRLLHGDRQLDNKVCIESIGFTLMDGKDGPFCFDLARIRAVNFYDDGDRYSRQGGPGVWEGVKKKAENNNIR